MYCILFARILCTTCKATSFHMQHYHTTSLLTLPYSLPPFLPLFFIPLPVSSPLHITTHVNQYVVNRKMIKSTRIYAFYQKVPEFTHKTWKCIYDLHTYTTMGTCAAGGGSNFGTHNINFFRQLTISNSITFAEGIFFKKKK